MLGDLPGIGAMFRARRSAEDRPSFCYAKSDDACVILLSAANELERVSIR